MGKHIFTSSPVNSNQYAFSQFNLYKRTSNPRPRLPPNDYYYNHPRSDNEELRAYRRPKMSQRSSSSERDEWSYARPSRQSNYNFRDVDNAGRPQYDDEEDYVARQRRTTAIQRNTSNRQPSRVQPRDLEVRRQWISSGGKYSVLCFYLFVFTSIAIAI